jgi:hypothetical protein
MRSVFILEMTYRRVFKISRTTGATSGAETSLPFPSNLVHPQFLGGPLFVFHCPFSFYHCIVFLSLYCLFIIVLSFYHCIVFLSLYCLFIRTWWRLFWAYLMKVIPETRSADYIWYLRFFLLLLIKYCKKTLKKSRR